MDLARYFLIVAGVVIAFRAGYAWRHHKRTWADHKIARTGEKKLRKLRWKTLFDGILAVAGIVGFLVIIAWGTHLAGQTTKATPASVTQTPAHRATHAPTPTPTGHKTR